MLSICRGYFFGVHLVPEDLEPGLERSLARPFRDKRFAKCTIRQVGTPADEQAAWDQQIEILVAIRRRLADNPSDPKPPFTDVVPSPSVPKDSEKP